MNNNLRHEKNSEQQPINVTKKLESKLKNSNIMSNLYAFIIPFLISQDR